MRKTILLIILAAFNFNIYAKRIKPIIKGFIKQPTKEISIILFNGNLAERTIKIPVINGYFQLRKPKNNNFNIGILIANNSFTFVSLSGKPYTLKIDKSKESIFKYQGKGAKDQIILNEFIKSLEKMSPFNNIERWTISYKQTDNKIQNLKEKSYKLINSISKYNSNLKIWMNTYLKANIFNYKTFYCALYQNTQFRESLSKYTKVINLINQDIPYSFLGKERFNFNDKYYGNISDDIELFTVNIWKQINCLKDRDHVLKQIKANKSFKEIKGKKVNDIYIKRHLNILANIDNINNYQQFATISFMKNSSYNKDWATYLEIIKSKIKGNNSYKIIKRQFSILKQQQEYLNVIKDLPPASFICKDINGRDISLELFKGKYIVLDFWASWCSPCRKEIPFLKEIHEEFKNKKIVFLSISIDSNIRKWKDFVNNNRLIGIQIRAGYSQRELSKHYKIRGVPKFILLGKDGKIIIPNLPRPSNPNFKRILNYYTSIKE